MASLQKRYSPRAAPLVVRAVVAANVFSRQQAPQRSMPQAARLCSFCNLRACVFDAAALGVLLKLRRVGDVVSAGRGGLPTAIVAPSEPPQLIQLRVPFRRAPRSPPRNAHRARSTKCSRHVALHRMLRRGQRRCATHCLRHAPRAQSAHARGRELRASRPIATRRHGV